jgi:hypothetical protein
LLSRSNGAERRNAIVDIEIMPRKGYLHIAVAERKGVGQAKDALQRILDAIGASDQRRLLVSVRQSEAIFNVAEYGLLDALTRLAGVPGLRVALVADSDELLVSYRYVEALASERRLTAKAFRDEEQALAWLNA